MCIYIYSSPKSKKPKKLSAVKETSMGGSGAAYKSREFISDNESSGSDSENKPLEKKKPSRRGKKGSSSESEVGSVRCILVTLDPWQTD